MLGDKIVQISCFQQRLQSKNLRVAQTHGELQEEIAKLKTMLVEKDAEIGQLQESITRKLLVVTDKDTEIARLQQALASKDQSITQTVADKDAEITRLQQALALKDQRIAHLEQQVESPYF